MQSFCVEQLFCIFFRKIFFITQISCGVAFLFCAQKMIIEDDRMQALQRENICWEKKKQINLQHDCNVIFERMK